MKIKNKKDFGLGIFGILFSLWIAFYAMSYIPEAKHAGDPGPKLFPLIGAGIMLVCSVAILFNQEEPKRDKDGNIKPFLTKKQWLAAGKVFGIYCLMTLLFYLIGFTATVPIILFILTFMLSKVSAPDTPKKQRIIKILIFAIVAGALIYCAYILGLQARLPKGIIWKLFK